MIRRLGRTGLGLITTLAIAGCVAQSDARTSPAEETPSDGTLAEGLAEEPATPSAPAQEDRDVPASFTFEGELTQGGWIKGVAPAGAVSAQLGGTNLKIGRYGDFFAAFDRDAGDEAVLKATMADGSVVEQRLAISPRAWKIERVNVAKGTGRSSEEWWKKREPEWLAIKAAREKETGAKGWQQDFVWPVKGRISGLFGSQRIYRGEPGSYHSGLDIAPGAGTPFVAPADGVVVLAATGFSLEGNLLIIDHGMGLNSAFLHAQSLNVKEGDVVKQGQLIGRVGSTGRSSGPHLHWGIKWNDARLDPLLFLPDAD
ncbi:M23 family metallopeptidase [Altererythrobacter lutimaris]|uniref:M23 family metallopeptidase n=1 Tax=Altererythrobacter lutimaris TaxID=2743979 RepID=A0A850HC51_9SPHN|nr:M23 family metallopeptidase [Altererythrobacter lutimaris]NVE95339.1 M23 family metallopeptidase [Altererythrobacter lutimaris]